MNFGKPYSNFAVIRIHQSHPEIVSWFFSRSRPVCYHSAASLPNRMQITGSSLFNVGQHTLLTSNCEIYARAINLLSDGETFLAWCIFVVLCFSTRSTGTGILTRDCSMSLIRLQLRIICIWLLLFDNGLSKKWSTNVNRWFLFHIFSLARRARCGFISNQVRRIILLQKTGR